MEDTEAFATITDFEKRWVGLSERDALRVEALLEDASDLIRSTCPDWRDVPVSTLKRITCQVARRALISLSEASGVGVSSMSTTDGPFTQQISYANPQGDLYLTRSEKKSLGVGVSRAFEVDLLADSREPNHDG
jgi:hypothetical protein|nr:MAG TPA: hypothetical protein [Caudoviricetes sp.]